ncbi:hypothetical protein NQ318_019980 [Aromia moschata]|uniref:Uncharacterized protein n=1 Tax=Aromia moschata TaxID=1265417 RepID=A0AAV8Y5F2_9CUCU|nr:hypothetical protein NQ318_019980 [Aromia moschata]
MSLSDTQRIEILILLGCGDKTRTQKQTSCPRDKDVSKTSILRVLKKMKNTAHTKFIWFKNLTTMTLIADWNFAKSWQIDAKIILYL